MVEEYVEDLKLLQELHYNWINGISAHQYHWVRAEMICKHERDPATNPTLCNLNQNKQTDTL